MLKCRSGWRTRPSRVQLESIVTSFCVRERLPFVLSVNTPQSCRVIYLDLGSCSQQAAGDAWAVRRGTAGAETLWNFRSKREAHFLNDFPCQSKRVNIQRKACLTGIGLVHPSFPDENEQSCSTHCLRHGHSVSLCQAALKPAAGYTFLTEVRVRSLTPKLNLEISTGTEHIRAARI